MALVVEVVQERHVAPCLLVLAPLPGVGPHRRLDREAVPEQRLALRPLGEKGPRRVAIVHQIGHGRAHYRAGRDARGGRNLLPRRRIRLPSGHGSRDTGHHHRDLPHPRWGAALGHRPPRRKQERRPADPGGVRADGRPGHARQRPAHPRRRGHDRPAHGHRRRGRVARPQPPARVGRRHPKDAPRRRAVLADPGVDPLRRAASGPVRRGRHPAAGRRRHRPPPRRHPSDGLRRPRGRGRAPIASTGCRHPQAYAGPTSTSTRHR